MSHPVKNSLTSGSGVGIYQGFTQETSQLLKKYKNYCHLTRLASASTAQYPLPVAAVPLPVNLPINSSHQNLSLSPKISPNFEKIASGRRPLAIFSKFGLKKCLTTFSYFESFNSHKIETSKLASTKFSKRRLKNFRRHFSWIFIT